MQHPLQVRFDFNNEFNMLGKSDLRLHKVWIYVSNEGRKLLQVGAVMGVRHTQCHYAEQRHLCSENRGDK